MNKIMYLIIVLILFSSSSYAVTILNESIGTDYPSTLSDATTRGHFVYLNSSNSNITVTAITSHVNELSTRCEIWIINSSGQASEKVGNGTVTSNNCSITYPTEGVQIFTEINYAFLFDSYGASRQTAYETPTSNKPPINRSYITFGDYATKVGTGAVQVGDTVNAPVPNNGVGVIMSVYFYKETPTIISWLPPTPPDGTTNNTQVTINASCPSGDVTLYWGNSPTNLTAKVTAQPSPASYTSSENVSGTYYYIGSCDGGVTNTSARTVNLDFDFPLIILNPTNAFQTANVSSNNNYNYTDVPLNITFLDERDLYAVEILGYYPNGTIVYNYTNTSLTGTATLNYTDILDFSNFKKDQIYYFNISASDSHTAKAIKDYDWSKTLRDLTFNTAEGNEIIIKSLRNADWEVNKKVDRYSFTFAPYIEDSLNKYKFQVYCDNSLKYIENSEYAGHFVCGNAHGGNWLDFEGTDAPIDVTYEGDGWYEVELEFEGDSITFNSIGGLNVEKVTYQYYVGQYINYSVPTNGLSELNTVLYLNVSKGLNINDIVGASLYINGSYQASTKTDYGDYVIFETNFLTSVTSDTNYVYFWNVTYTETDASTTKFNTSEETFKVLSWFIDDGTLGNSTAFDVQVFNEKTGLPSTNINLTVSISYYVDGSPTVVKDYQANLYNNNTFALYKNPNSTVFRGDLTLILEGATIGSRTIKYYNVLLNDTFKVYSLELGDNNGFVTFRIQNSGGTAIESAIMQIERIINGSNQIIYNGITDFAGQITTYLDKLYTYDFTINATGYPLKTFSLQPSQTIYTITLADVSAGYVSPYDGIRFKVVPDINIINITNNFTYFTFYVEGDVEEIGINFSNHNYECIPADCEESLVGEGSVTIGIKVNSTGTFNTAYYFVLDGQRIYINDGIIKAVLFGFAGDNSLVDLIDAIRENTNAPTRSVMVALVSVIGVGVGSSMGLFGALLLLPVIAINIFCILPGIDLIHPLIGMIMVVFSFGIIVFTQMRDV